MDQIPTEAVGLALQHIREAQGLTQHDVSQRLGVTQSHVSKLEKGDRDLLLLEVFLYAPALDLTSEELFRELKRTLLAATGGHAVGASFPSQHICDGH